MASMGPRSRERGNDLAGILSFSLMISFNGAALTRARKFGGFYPKKTERSLASMGPRSRERGNITLGGDGTNYFDASMGPRSRERGNFLPKDAYLSVLTRFNGAALTRARKCRDNG